MKNLFLLFSFAMMSIFAFGQTPQAFKYQAVARNLNGDPVINQAISVKISILSGSPEGTVVYSELHQTTTNSLGLLNLEVGNGTAQTGNFTMIAWGNDACFVKTEMDLAGGDNFVFMGTSQLLSVPYSLFSDNGVPVGQNPGDMLYWNGTQWLKVNAGLNGQVLTFNDGVPVWGGVQLPILYTSAVTSISAFTANCGGTVVSDGGSPVIARGICWNSLPNPTTANNKTINGSGTGSFTGSMTGLAATSVYYVRAYATNSAGTSYGNEVSFTTTNGGITLTTTAITAITVNSATSGGNITNNGGSGVMARGVCWNTSPFPTTTNSKTTNGSGNGVFVSELTGLAPNTLYYVRAYATNSLGTSYGSQLSFTTLSGIITLTTTEVTEITASAAISGGEITNDGGSPVTVRGVCWSSSQNPTIADSTTNDGAGNGVFVSELTGLAANTLYYVRAYATNSLGTSYGSQLSFTTLSGIVTLTTAEVTEITATTAISGGEITSDGGSPVTVKGVCWSTSQNPTIVESTTNDGSGNGIFVSNLTGLTPNTLYYVRAYAANGVGTYYGNEVSFATLPEIIWECGDTIVDTRDNQSYPTVQIGTQCWMAKNLNIGTRIDGTSNQTDNGTIEKYCFNNDPSICAVYGVLYQWNEMMNYSTTPGGQGICPTNWHLPTDAEWFTLTTYLGGESVAGGKMKETGTTHWTSPNIGATNSSGFTGLPGGFYYGCSFYGLGIYGVWWSSTESSSNAWHRDMYYSNGGVGRYSSLDQTYSSSVRCLNNEIITSQLNVTPANQDVTALSGTTTFELTSNTSWAIEESASWLSVSPMSGSSDGILSVTYEANSSSEIRIGQLTITTAGGNPVVNVTVTQAGAPQWSCGIPILDSRDGKNYNTVQIGTQCWMAENLNVGMRIDDGQGQSNNGTLEKYCYGDLETNCDVYGGLYEWDEMMEYVITSGTNGICPDGWYIPTENDWAVLTNYVGTQQEFHCNNNPDFIAKALADTSLWSNYQNPCTVGNNLATNNGTGFTARPAGIRDAPFQAISYYAEWWTSTYGGWSSSVRAEISYSSEVVSVEGGWDKWRGLSVRCIKIH